MKFLALLRAINVGGNSIIKMEDLRKAFKNNGLNSVKTYIQSGNVIFESGEKNISKVEEKIEEFLSREFKYNSRVVVITHDQMKQILSDVPIEWKKQKDLRCYIAFMKNPATPTDMTREVQLKQGVDFVKEGKGVIYMTTLMSGLMKSGFTKLITKKIYQSMTMRNYNTCQRILLLMEAN